jgi:hypothetical protein
MRKRKLVGAISVILFSVGVLLGVILMGVTVWADLEATLFNPQARQYQPFRSLRCPIIITPEETGIIRARFKNTLDREIDFFIRAHISHGYVTLRREVITELALAPGETERVEWEINAEDAAFERLVLFRMTARGAYPLPNRQGTCGVLLVETSSLRGNQIVAILLAGSLVLTLGGGGLWFATHREMLELQMQLSRAMGFLTVSTILGIIVSLMGWWVFGAFFLVVILLAVGVILGYFVNSETPAA